MLKNFGFKALAYIPDEMEIPSGLSYLDALEFNLKRKKSGKKERKKWNYEKRKSDEAIDRVNFLEKQMRFRVKDDNQDCESRKLLIERQSKKEFDSLLKENHDSSCEFHQLYCLLGLMTVEHGDRVIETKSSCTICTCPWFCSVF